MAQSLISSEGFSVDCICYADMYVSEGYSALLGSYHARRQNVASAMEYYSIRQSKNCMNDA